MTVSITPLILCADDYAQSSAIDEGILALIEQGRLTATACLTLSPHWSIAAKRLDKTVRSKADIGLHLDFTQYAQPMQHSLPKLIGLALLRHLSPQLIRASIHRQLDRFEEALGSAPDYIDGHQHVHQLPQIREALLDIMAQRYANQLPWLRIAQPPAADGLKANIIGLLGAKPFKKMARHASLRMTEQLLGVYDLLGAAARAGDAQTHSSAQFTHQKIHYQKKLSGWLRIAQHYQQIHGHRRHCALMCHPALGNKTEQSDAIFAVRQVEYAVLSSNDFPQLLSQYGIKLSRGRDLAD